MRAWLLSAAALAAVLPVMTQRAMALPTMIRLSYINCSSCHISPQGGGLLNLYGRGIDQAQSFLGGEYEPSRNLTIQTLNWGGRIVQDIRYVVQQQDLSTTGKAGTQIFRNRLMYRNATELGRGFRLTAMVTGENTSAPRPSLVYEHASRPAQFFVNTALLSYRPRKTLEFAMGRDQLPTGVNIPDLAVFVRSRNRLGYYDSATQVKAFWWGSRYFVSPYAFGPAGNERSGEHESGGGAIAEFDVLGRHRTVAGLNLLHGTATNMDRTLIGPYVRLGFGKWGILAEHDLTERSSKTGTHAAFRQTASYGQFFWAAREWLVPSLIVERLRVQQPYQENLIAAKLELSARITPQLTLSAGPRIQRDQLTGRLTRSVVFQLTGKTVR